VYIYVLALFKLKTVRKFTTLRVKWKMSRHRTHAAVIKGPALPHFWQATQITVFISTDAYKDRLCGLVVTVSGYRSRGPGFDSRPYQIF
jgi:hypothetical protein